ncbi:MAG: ribbon-helix-helix protein, CopG family [Lachnospiraceae bacterium]|nr:ribbon-helix-helix protein, CopG family [Lachnospiraceae bacterium]
MKPLKQKVSITLDSDMLETLKKLADEDDRSLSQYINLVLKRHLAKMEAKTKR